jgi:hypothetical protein
MTLIMDSITGWYRHCKKYHFESCGEDKLVYPSERCPKLAADSPIVGVYMEGDGGGNMVGGRLAEEFARLPHQKTLSKITDEEKTSQK